jgi:dipeptidyl aminopeptidase/acylaminoacyl peptidase/predicted Ser/Thr protein kinase
MALAAGTRLGPYEILSHLGAGGMGEVWRARDTRVDRAVALKVLPEEFFESEERRTRFEREAKLLASLNHPGIATLYSFEEIPGSSSPDSTTPHVLVMEMLEGETLRERLRAGALPVRKAVDIAVQMAKALAAAHEKGIVHRDLKPENVFLTRDERVKILDFGLAKISRREQTVEKPAEAGTISLLTEAGAVLGTASYMSPEQVRGEPVDSRSDIFSFGTIVYEMLSGTSPFRRESTPEWMTAILKEEPPSLFGTAAGAAPALSAIVGRCLEKTPEARFQSSADLAFALLSLSPLPAAPVPRRSWMGVAALMLAVGLALGLALARNWSGGERPVVPEFTRLTFRRGTVMNARFAPNGTSILYSANWEGQPPRAYSTRPGEPEIPVGPPDAFFLAASRNGQLAFALRPAWDASYRGTLATTFGGPEAPREISEGVAAADWAADGTSMAIVRQEEARRRWILEYPSGVRLFESAAEILQARVSPDGRDVAFILRKSLDECSVVVASDGGRTTTLSGGWRNGRGLAWSPSGEEILISASKEGGSQSLWAIRRSGNVRAVANWGGNWVLQDVAADGRLLMTQGPLRLSMTAFESGTDLTWFDWTIPAGLTPDGRTILFQERGDGVGGKSVAFTRPTDGSPAVRIGEGAPAAISPDGQRALVYRSGPPRLVLVSAGPEKEKTLPAGDVREFGPAVFAYPAAFFPEGRRVVFLGAGADERMRLWVQDLDGGPPRPFGTAESCYNPVVSPDGGSIAARSVTRKRLIIFSDSGAVRREVDLGPDDSLPIGWLSDNRSVFLRVRKGNETRIDRLDTLSGRRDVWRDLRIQDPAGILKGAFLTFISVDGKTIITSYFRVLNDLYLVEGLK